MNSFLRWVLLFSMTVAVAVVVHFYGGYTTLAREDPTFISFAVLALFGYMTGRIGYLNYLFARNQYDPGVLHHVRDSLDSGWLSASLCSRLGMLGTIWGFILAVQGFAGIDVANVAKNQIAMQNISTGVSIALYTTLVGQIANILLTVQSFNLNAALKRVLGDK